MRRRVDAPPPAGQPEQLFLSFDLGVTRRPDGSMVLVRRRLQIKGDVQAARKVLGCSRDTVLRLIEEGRIRARKLRPGRRNSKYVVDMASVYEAARLDAAKADELHGSKKVTQIPQVTQVG